MNKLMHLSAEDLVKIVDLHLKYLPDGLLAALGRPFLKEFYSALSADPDVFIIVKRSGSDIVGFITGGTSLAGVKHHFLSNVFFTFWLLRHAVFKPRLVLQLLMSIQRSLSKGGGNTISVPVAELYSLVVCSSLRRKGIASQLYDELCTTFKTLGVNNFEIIVGSKLKQAQRFYEVKGAAKVRTIKQGLGKRSFVYVHRLQSERF